ncbi:MAG: CRTAC1 family protein [Pseudomonadota bacterium]
MGATAASAWGDLNADGWPDLWVSNHHAHAPNLYINQRDGTFVDAAVRLSDAAARGASGWPDFHGAAWGDADNDGDQDLLIISGGGAGRGASANHFYRNDGEVLRQLAVSAGIDYPLGRGRTPLWFDADGDGRLDALVMNKHRAEAPSAVFVQSDSGRFEPAPLVDAEPGWLDEMFELINRWFGGEAEQFTASIEFPLLTGQTAKGAPRLATLDARGTTRVWDGAALRGTGETLPAVTAVQDAAVADFDGDGALDWFLLRSRPGAQEVRFAPQAIAMKLSANADKPKGLKLTTPGDLSVSIFRPWMDPTDARGNEPLALYRGDERVETLASNHRFDAADEALRVAPGMPNGVAGVRVTFDAATSTWTLMTSAGQVNYEFTASQPFEGFETIGFKSFDGAMQDAMLWSGSRLEELKRGDTPCQSVAAADFDNDTDVDMYLVCATPAGDADDLLLLNVDGRFEVQVMPAVPGRGNQVAAADYDNDGFVDLAITNGAGPPPFADRGRQTLLRNRGNDNHWIALELVGTRSNRDGVGARVTLSAGGKQQVRLQDNGIHSFSQDHDRLHFGLGASERVDHIEIHWPSGIRQTLENVAADAVVEVREPT